MNKFILSSDYFLNVAVVQFQFSVVSQSGLDTFVLHQD